MSHLASADNPEDPLNKLQINNFEKALTIVENHGIKPEWIHIQNSDGLSLHLFESEPFRLIPQSRRLGGVSVNMARVGLALYGISDDSNLKPVLSLKSKIIQIKRLRKGDRVGYDGTYTAKKTMTLGVLPLGYFDGVDRRLSNKGYVSVDGVVCPIIGLVSMNITTVDLSRVPNPQIGQEVFVYSNNRTDKNSIVNSAKICGTIPYDLLVHLTSSTKRVIV